MQKKIRGKSVNPSSLFFCIVIYFKKYKSYFSAFAIESSFSPTSFKVITISVID